MRRLRTSLRLYRLLLYLYPSAFRRDYGEEMARVFEDVVMMDYARTKGLEFAWLWLQTLGDVVRTAFQERSRVMNEQKLTLPMILGGIAILPALLFFSIMMLTFGLGVDNFLYDAWDQHWARPDNRPLIATMADIIIILGPAVAFLLAALPLVRVNLQRESGVLVGTVRLKLNVSSLIIIGVSVLVGGAFVLYFFAENFEWAAP